MEVNMFYDLLVTLTSALAAIAIVMIIYGEYISIRKKKKG